VSSWLDTNIAQELSEKIELSIIGPLEIIELAKTKNFNKNKISFIEMNLPPSTLISKAYFFVGMITKRKINSSFRIRIKYLVFGELKIFPKPFKFKTFYICAKSNLKNFLFYLKNYQYQLLAFIPIIDSLIFKFLRICYKYKKSIIPDTINANYDWIIFAGGNIEVQIYEMIKGLKNSRTKTILCIENWDNLTSKRFVISVPDFIFVIGEDTARQSAGIQGIDEKIIIPAGLPRLNPYRKKIESSAVNDFSMFTILYLGFYQPHNEIKLINFLIRELNSTSIRDQFQILYKPHPGPRSRFMDDSSFEGPVKIIQAESRANPKIDAHHMNIMLKSNIVISTPTTMVIESMLLGKKTILDVTNDGVHRSTTGEAFKNYMHLKILNSISNLYKCYRPENILEHILDEFNNPTNHFIYYDLTKLIENTGNSYSDHILRAIK
jgi:hypothetical protein